MPKSAILIDVAEVYLHCSKALIRSKLWQQDYRVERGVLPSMAQMIADQAKEGGTYDKEIDVQAAEKRVQDSYTHRLY